MSFILNLFSPAARKRARLADDLYKGLMTAALSPEAFATGLVADDMDHRVQMVAVHAALLAWQLPLRPEDALRRLPEAIHTRVFDGFDAALREKGVGDSSIARKVRKLGEHYYGLGAAVAEALSGPADLRESALADVFRRNGVTAPGREGELAAHMATLAGDFETYPSDTYLAGSAPWQAFPATSRRGVAKG